MLPQRTRIKICGLTREADLDVAVESGADAVGFVLYPKSPRHVPIARAAELETFQYGRWTGTANTDDSGSFSRCAVTGRFKRASVTSGREVAAAIALDRINGWTLGFAGGDTGAVVLAGEVALVFVAFGWHEELQGGAATSPRIKNGR